MTGPQAERVEQLVLEINVTDLEQSLATYTALGLTLLFPSAPEPGQASAGPDVSIRRIAFRVDRSAFDQARAALPAHGITARFDDHGVAHSLYFDDPDGHQLDITTYDFA